MQPPSAGPVGHMAGQEKGMRFLCDHAGTQGGYGRALLHGSNAAQLHGQCGLWGTGLTENTELECEGFRINQASL